MRADLKKRPNVTAGEAMAHMLILAVVAASMGASFFFETTDYREGPIAAARGTVTNIAMDATSAYGLPREMITVQLAHGPRVVATAPRGLPIRRGATVIVDTYRYHLTGTRAYRVHGFMVHPHPVRAGVARPPLSQHGPHFHARDTASRAGGPVFAGAPMAGLR